MARCGVYRLQYGCRATPARFLPRPQGLLWTEGRPAVVKWGLVIWDLVVWDLVVWELVVWDLVIWEYMWRV
jgi:hypothetical protein